MTMLLTMWQALRAKVQAESGQDFIEYALILGVITLVIILAFLTTGIGSAITSLVTAIQACIDGAASTACAWGENPQ